MGASQVVLAVKKKKKTKNMPTNAGDIREADFIPGSGRAPGGGHDNLLLAWKLLWTEEPGRLQSMTEACPTLNNC